MQQTRKLRYTNEKLERCCQQNFRPVRRFCRYFENPFTVYHALGTALVFGGTLLFPETLQRVYAAVRPHKHKRE